VFKKDLILSLFMKILGLFMGLIISIIMARVLGIASFGDYSLAFTWINVIVLIAIAGNTENILRQTPRNTKQYIMSLSKVVKRQSLLFYVIFGLSFYTIISQSNIDSYSSTSFRISYFLAFIYGLLNVPNRIVQSSVTGNYLNYVVSRINLLYTPLSKFIFIVIIYWLTKNKYAVIASIFLAEFVAYVIYHQTYKKVYHGILEHLTMSRKPIVNIYFMVISISYMLLSISDRIMLSFWLPIDEIGGYTAATRISNTVMVFCVGFLPFLPKISELYHNNNIKTLEASFLVITKLISVFTFPLVIYLVIYADHLLNLFGQRFSSYAIIVAILVLGKMFDAVTGPAGSLLSMTKFEKYDMRLILAMSIINIIMNALFIPRFGAIGAAISTFISTSIVQIIIIVIAGRVISIKTYSLNHFIMFVLFLILLSSNYLIKQIYHPDIFYSIFILVINYIIFIGLTLMFNIIKTNDIKNMLRG